MNERIILLVDQCTGAADLTAARHNEFVELTDYHRKHAIRVLCREAQPPRAKPGPQRRYDDDVRAALITLWEAADRICGRRLKALIPTLIDSMTRHGHLSLPKDLRQRLKQISAATIAAAAGCARASLQRPAPASRRNRQCDSPRGADQDLH
jgi:hypothetical protein